MIKQVKFAIIGAGTVGLTALGIIRKQTENFVLIQDGPYGTTCARVGCMPSKALIHAANHFYHATHSDVFGVRGAEHLTLDQPHVMQRVRAFRDRFTGGVEQGTTDTLKSEQLIEGRAELVGPNLIEVNGQRIEAERIIIGTGSRPAVPQAWQQVLGERLITSDHIFELETLPKRIAVIGLGVIGLELGQALARMGVEVTGFEATERIGGLQAPQTNSVAQTILNADFKIHLGQAVDVETEGEHAVIVCGDERVHVDKVLVSIGRRPNLDGLGLQSLGVALDERGMPPFNPQTMQVADLPVFLAGDAANYRPILHEAGEEGRIATMNAIHYPNIESFKRKTPLGVTFTEPGLAFFGQRFSEVNPASTAIAEFSLERNNGRAIVMGEDHGMILLFADKSSRKLIGGELVMPQAEHMAHLLNWVTELGLTVDQILDLPFYHPVLEEAVESALKTLRSELKTS
jgi:dihydrolipoamide dehydrogenase